jgi:hypothetical protein
MFGSQKLIIKPSKHPKLLTMAYPKIHVGGFDGDHLEAMLDAALLCLLLGKVSAHFVLAGAAESAEHRRY